LGSIVMGHASTRHGHHRGGLLHNVLAALGKERVNS